MITIKAVLGGFARLQIWPKPVQRDYPTDAEAIADDWRIVMTDLDAVDELRRLSLALSEPEPETFTTT